MQPPDRIQRGQDRALLPGRQLGGVLAGEHDAAVDLAEIGVMLLARILRPVALQPSVNGTRCQATATPFSNSD